MSVMMTPESGVRPHGWARCIVTMAVGAAWWLSHLPPRFLVPVLRQVMRGRRPSTGAEVAAARRAVCATSVRCAGQAGCLQRSLATVLTCAAAGHSPSWRSGFRIDPFVAHAWVAVEGDPVGESPGVRDYTVLFATDPGRSR